MNGIEQIQKAIDNDEMMEYIVGIKEYGFHEHHMDYVSDFYQFYDLSLKEIYKFHTLYPDKGVDEIYKKTMEIMVQIPLYCFFALISLKWQTEFEKNNVATFKVDNIKDLLKTGLDTLKNCQILVKDSLQAYGRPSVEFDQIVDFTRSQIFGK